MHIPEFLIHHIIEEEFFNIFRPIYIIQTILGSVRVHYKDKYISGTTVRQKIYGFIVTLIALHSFYFLNYKLEINNYDKDTIFAKTIQFIPMIFMCFSVIISNVFTQTKSNTSIYVAMQNVDRTLKLLGEEDYIKMFRRNLISCVTMFTIYIIMSLSFIITKYQMNSFFNNIVIFLGYMVYSIEDFELLAFLSIINFLHLRIQHLNNMMNKLIMFESTKFDEHFAEAYQSIADVYKLLQRLYRLYVSDL